MKRKIYFFSHFPPPVHGFSNVNQFIYNKLITGGLEVKRFSFVSSSKNTAIFYLKRILKAVYATLLVLKHLFSSRDDIFYMPVSGGAGMIFEALPWIFSGLSFKKSIMHHHSFQYCYKRSFMMGMMQKFNQKNTYNVFLCHCHYEAFKKNYAINSDNVYIIGNEMTLEAAAAAGGVLPVASAEKMLTIGHLSNLSAEKGFYIFCDLVEKLASTGKNIRFELAGPAGDAAITSRITELQAKFPANFIYRGSLYGEQKNDWYRALDFFVFPSVYKNETFPLVIVEAILLGVIPLTTNIACIPEYNNKAFTFSPDDFTAGAANVILTGYDDEAYYETLKAKLADTKRKAELTSKKELEDIMHLFKN
ncbi:glycosyltransferase family 4 protein [Mucilaginibacter sp. cycad4]|uniref:glycosyltransferase family 4 protein n=1 Tax=Mucilaginibacter sp. cycad4 TaxID=3342096 RepID=UPI002AAB746F|nr:glycosyltransferase family 4 protein [Mucilaginibacter gossypii]WPV00229.1 glycosyltransferase family 4 protein [Mucilaginibacter gossypii]